MYVDDLRMFSFLKINEKWQAYQDNTLANKLLSIGACWGTGHLRQRLASKTMNISAGDTSRSRWKDNDAEDSMVRT